jgi:hypothetical protein
MRGLAPLRWNPTKLQIIAASSSRLESLVAEQLKKLGGAEAHTESFRG